jgi:hypothetical protein
MHAISECHSQTAHIYLKIMCVATNTFIFNLKSKDDTLLFFVSKLKVIQ